MQQARNDMQLTKNPSDKKLKINHVITMGIKGS